MSLQILKDFSVLFFHSHIHFLYLYPLTLFFSIRCRNEGLASYHKYECRIASTLERTQLHRLPLVMASLRGITQKSVAFFKVDEIKGLDGTFGWKSAVCPNPSKMEQCWECTFLNLHTHVKTNTRGPREVITLAKFTIKTNGIFQQWGPQRLGIGDQFFKKRMAF